MSPRVCLRVGTKKRLFAAIDGEPTNKRGAKRRAKRPVKKKKRRTSAKKIAKTKKAKRKTQKKTKGSPPKDDGAPLDSLLLHWKAGKNKKIAKMSATKIIKGLKDERKFFRTLKDDACDTLVHKFRRAMRVVVKDELVLATMEGIWHGPTLKTAWIKLLTAHIKNAKKFNEDLVSPRPGSFVDKFLCENDDAEEEAAPAPVTESKAHPRGEDSDSCPDLVSVSSSSSSSESSSDSSSSDEDEPAKEKTKSSKGPRELKLNAETRKVIERLRKCRNVGDLDNRTVNWIADTFCSGSSHIQKIVKGRVKDPAHCKAELKVACAAILSLYDRVEIRQNLAASIAKEKRADLIKSESEGFDKLVVSLHLLRIGKAGADRFRNKVEDDLAREDFERAMGPRVYKIYKRELGECKVCCFVDDVLLTGPNLELVRRASAKFRSRAWWGEKAIWSEQAEEQKKFWRRAFVRRQGPRTQLWRLEQPPPVVRFSRLQLETGRRRIPQEVGQLAQREEAHLSSHLA